MHVRASARYPPARASACCTAQHIATPTMNILNLCEENFRDQKSNHKIHKSIVPRKFEAIRCVFYSDQIAVYCFPQGTVANPIHMQYGIS